MHTCAMDSQFACSTSVAGAGVKQQVVTVICKHVHIHAANTRTPPLFKIRVWRRGSLEADADADSPPTIRTLTPDGGTRETVENLVFSKIVSLETGRVTSAARYILLGDRKPLQRPMTHCPRSATCIAGSAPALRLAALIGFMC
jgi:hypothetical protein